MLQSSSRCFCAFCKSQRSIYRQKHLSIVDVLMTAFASVLLSFIVWQELDPKALVFFALGLAVVEVFIIFRRRMSMPCPSCGFDPVLYKRNAPEAARRVKAFLEDRKQDPLSVFRPSPRLPFLIKSSASRPANHSANQSSSKQSQTNQRRPAI